MARTFMQMAQEAMAAVPGIGPAEARQRMQEHPDTLPVDVRDAADTHATGVIPGAVNVSLGMLPVRADQELPEAWRDPRLQDRSSTGVLSVERTTQEDGYPVSTALEIIYTLLNQAVIGYSMLHSVSTRFLDSLLIAEEGTSYHLTRQHTQNYVQAIQQIARLFHDVVLWELDQNGLGCQCICPSCRVGICLCALAGVHPEYPST